MKLADYRRDNVAVFSGTASTVARQLSFAGLAIVWIFSSVDGQPNRVPEEIVPAALVIVAALALDLLQYVVAAIVWASYLRIWELHAPDPDVDFDVPAQINWPGNTLFALKLFAVAFAYVLLGGFLLDRML